jgi:hypothetical protein
MFLFHRSAKGGRPCIDGHATLIEILFVLQELLNKRSCSILK